MTEKYMIGEMAELLGVTTHMLRHYEKLGIICPEVDETNGYRYYSVIDTRRFNLSRELLACGIHLEQVARLLTDMPAEEMSAVFDQAIAAQKKQILLSGIAVRFLSHIREDFADLSAKLDRVWVENLRPMWRLNVSEKEEAQLSPSLKRQREAWLSCLPAVYWTSRIRREELHRFGTGPIRYEYGLMCYEEDALALGLEKTPEVETVPGGDYIVTVYSKSKREPFTWEDLRVLTDFVIQEGLQFHGDAYSQIFWSQGTENSITNYHRVFMKIYK